MARIRTIKPEFFTSADVTSMTPLARLLFIGLWGVADREGRMKWRPADFKLQILPGDNCDIQALCQEILSGGMVVLYGDGFAYIPSFLDHQSINPRETASKLPPPDACVTRAHASIPDPHEQWGREGKGREGNGKDEVEESPPASTHSTAAKPGADKRGTRLTDNWQLTPELRAFAVDHGLDPDGLRDEFVDYWTSVPGSKGLKLDWGKTFKNRCRELSKKPTFGGGRSAPKETFDQRRIREAMEVISDDRH